MQTLNQLLVEHFRCPDAGVEFLHPDAGNSREGYFLFGEEVVCYGRASAASVAKTVEDPLRNVFIDTQFTPGQCALSFDAVNCVENLRRERYVTKGEVGSTTAQLQGLGRGLYYFVRPCLPVSIRRHLQRWVLMARMNARFPSWPVDLSGDRLLESLLAVSMKAQGVDRIPFIWFWPDGHSSAAIMTHDVETLSGLQFCSTLMTIDESYRIPASFQLVPEDRYTTSELTLEEFRLRGFEINIHDLNHDGRLYWHRDEFLRRAEKINAYRKDFRAKGFRSGTLYRNLDWYDALDFSYDMSVPNVAHLDPQPGGCCTAMPFFIGDILELPVTVTQDYPLFHILRDHSIELWTRQIRLIRQGHGLISMICHPDYLQETRARKTYLELLDHLDRLRSDTGLWIALPSEINDWWRVRNQLRLVPANGAWNIEGRGRERARIAYARLQQDTVHFELPGNNDLLGKMPKMEHTFASKYPATAIG